MAEEWRCAFPAAVKNGGTEADFRLEWQREGKRREL